MCLYLWIGLGCQNVVEHDINLYLENLTRYIIFGIIKSSKEEVILWLLYQIVVIN